MRLKIDFINTFTWSFIICVATVLAVGLIDVII